MDRMALQREIEEGSVQDGIERFETQRAKARNRGDEINFETGRKFVKRLQADMIRLYCAETTTTKRRSPLEGLRGIPAADVCLAATRAALASVMKTKNGEQKHTSTCEQIGRELYRLVHFRVAVKKRNRSKNRRHRMKEWPNLRMIKVGARFADYLVQSDVFERVQMPSSKGKPAHGLRLTLTAKLEIEGIAWLMRATRPLNPVCVVEPREWVSPTVGGYHFRNIGLVKRVSEFQGDLLGKAHGAGKLQSVYASLNALQGVSWRINPKVYEIASRLIAEGKGPGIVKRPTHKVSKKEKSNWVVQTALMAEADKAISYGHFFLPYSLDRRGRVYPAPDHLSFDGRDLQRGLVEFSKGDPMTGDSERWLRIHLANTYGKDKQSFDARVAWAREHERKIILASASDPYRCKEWHKAKDPWQFLAACFAWKDYAEHGAKSVCRLPIMLDGSCSAFQHWAALLRDEAVAHHVNLIDQPVPGDLYERVAEKTMELLREDRGRFCRRWYNWKIDRKVVKRATMVVSYGASHKSRSEYVRELFEDAEENLGRRAPSWLADDDTLFKAVSVLTTKIYQAVAQVAPGLLTGMTWVRKLVRVWKDQAPRKPIWWEAPTGFPVFRDNYEPCEHSVKAVCDGQPLWLTYYTPKRPLAIRWGKVETSTPPNFVHSLDAAHLMRSVVRASTAGVKQIVTVHDAFGTTPAKTGKLVSILRKEFTRLYKEDHFKRLAKMAKAAGVTPPAGPSVGSLNVAQIGRATYLFC